MTTIGEYLVYRDLVVKVYITQEKTDMRIRQEPIMVFLMLPPISKPTMRHTPATDINTDTTFIRPSLCVDLDDSINMVKTGMRLKSIDVSDADMYSSPVFWNMKYKNIPEVPAMRNAFLSSFFIYSFGCMIFLNIKSMIDAITTLQNEVDMAL